MPIPFSKYTCQFAFAKLVALVVLWSAGGGVVRSEPAVEPGAERDGLRLRLAIVPSERNDGGNEVRLDVINVSQRDMTLRTAWERDDRGNVEDYLEAATSIESFPPFEPWKGGVQAYLDKPIPQVDQLLKAGETLAIRWHAKGRQLKNRVSNPFDSQNPIFELPGLYAIHANLEVVTAQGKISLRSNEQMVSFGGSIQAPKHTYGPVWNINEEKKTALLGLGTDHQVKVGDRFAVSTKQARWEFTVTKTDSRYSTATLAVDRSIPGAQFPTNEGATLIGK